MRNVNHIPSFRPGRDELTEQAVYGRYRDGLSVEALASQFRRSKGAIRSLIREVRVRHIMSLPLDHMYNPEFEAEDAEQVILGPTPQPAKPSASKRRPPGLPPYLASLYEMPLLTREQEVHLFRKYNYLKFRAESLRSQMDPQRPRARMLDEIEQLYEQAVEVKNQLTRANLRLVVSIARRHISDPDQLFDLISDGNESLMRAVEKFDYSRGFKFSTYASWAIKNNFARNYAAEMKHRDRFRTSSVEMFDAEPERRPDPHQQLRQQAARETDVRKVLKWLPDRERRVIVRRFGLAPGEEPKTLQQLAVEFGISKERVRQLESRAMNKLREAAAQEKIEMPEPA